MSREVRPPLVTRDFVLLGAADLAYFTGIGVAVLLLPRWATGPVGAGEAGAGLAFGAFAITALVCRPYAGRLSDRHGRRALMVGGAALCAAGMAVLPLVTSLAGVVAVRLVQGVAEAGFFVAGFALLADLAPAERLGEALSYNSLGLYLGFALGPPLGAWVLGEAGFVVAWEVSAGLVALATVLTLLIAEPEREAGDEGHSDLLHRPSIPVAVAFLTSLAAVSGFLAFGALHAARIGFDNAGVPMLAYGLVVVVCRLVFARVPDRLPPLPLAAVSLAGIAVGLVLMAALATPAGFLVGVVVMSVGVAFATPALFTAVFATAAPSERGAASGTASAAIDLALGLGPILAGALAQASGIPAAFVAGAVVALAGAAWSLLLARRRQPSSGIRTQSTM
jgi:predicted MFS family arabinose efflux permease